MQDHQSLRFPNLILNWTTYEYFLRRIAWFYSKEFHLTDSIEVKEKFQKDGRIFPFALVSIKSEKKHLEIIPMVEHVSHLFLPYQKHKNEYELKSLEDKDKVYLGLCKIV